MANPEHLKILKQGVEVWNRWREESPLTLPNLAQANLNAMDLEGVNLAGTNLRETSLRQAKLINAEFIRADLLRADLAEVNLSGATLNRADLSSGDLSKATLSGARLLGTDLSRANLKEANFYNAILAYTILGDVDLSVAEGLEKVEHVGPSHISVATLLRSRGKIPEVFLRGAGVSDTFITYVSSLTQDAIQYYSCFISYSSKDEAFAQRLHADLQQKGVRCWFAPEDMKIGAKIRPTIDQSIRIHDKLLVILSENSMQSDWVEDEVETAIEEEKKRGETVLFPIRLDDTVMGTDEAWAAKLRRTRHIGDFSQWKDHDAYQQAFERLLRDLKAEG